MCIKSFDTRTLVLDHFFLYNCKNWFAVNTLYSMCIKVLIQDQNYFDQHLVHISSIVKVERSKKFLELNCKTWMFRNYTRILVKSFNAKNKLFSINNLSLLQSQLQKLNVLETYLASLKKKFIQEQEFLTNNFSVQFVCKD